MTDYNACCHPSDGAIHHDVIDRDRLASISDGEREFEVELLDAYIEDARDCLADIEAALVVSNWSTVAAVAHQLKGASGNVGASRMLELCAQLEQDARGCRQSEAIELLQRALTAVKEVAQQW